MEVEEIDATVAERHPCPKCGSSMHYEGYHKPNGYRCEYLALAICDSCGHQVAF